MSGTVRTRDPITGETRDVVIADALAAGAWGDPAEIMRDHDRRVAETQRQYREATEARTAAIRASLEPLRSAIEAHGGVAAWLVGYHGPDDSGDCKGCDREAYADDGEGATFVSRSWPCQTIAGLAEHLGIPVPARGWRR